MSFGILLLTDMSLTYFSALLLALYQRYHGIKRLLPSLYWSTNADVSFFEVELRTMGKVLIFLPEHGSQLQVDTEQTDG